MRADRRIMVTDYYPETCDFMVDALTAEGYWVSCCPEAALTAEDIRDAQPDMLILELRRTDQASTLLLLDQLRSRMMLRSVPVLVTSTDPRLLRDLAPLLRHLDCITLAKPFELDDFLDRIAQALAPRCASAGDGGALSYD